MKIRTYVIGTIIIFAILIAWILYDQNTYTPEPAPSPHSPNEVSGNNEGVQFPQDYIFGDNSGSLSIDLPPSTLPIGDDGLIEATIPQNLFGGKDKTAEEYVKDYHDNPNSDLIVSKVILNDDGTVTMLLTPEQLKRIRENVYEAGQFQKTYDVASIMNVVYEDNMLTEITVLVDSELYHQNFFERFMCKTVLAGMAGSHQVFSGTPPDEWHTTITIKDADTGKVISETDFPNDDMYIAY